jgi:P-type E1-E2 ATPase
MEHDYPVVFVAWDECVKGLFTFQETVRPEARETLRECRSLGLKSFVLTGDHDHRASNLAAQLELPVESELLPDEKMERIAAARTGGLVAMVGDGINDAPALAASDVGIALGCGADISRESASVCLLSNDLSHIPWTVRLARETVRMIRINLFWAFAYNVVGIIFAATGWLSPALAALFMVLSSLLVIANSRRLGQFEFHRKEAGPGQSGVPRVPAPNVVHSDSMFDPGRSPVAIRIDQNSLSFSRVEKPC